MLALTAVSTFNTGVKKVLATGFIYKISECSITFANWAERCSSTYSGLVWCEDVLSVCGVLA